MALRSILRALSVLVLIGLAFVLWQNTRDSSPVAQPEVAPATPVQERQEPGSPATRPSATPAGAVSPSAAVAPPAPPAAPANPPAPPPAPPIVPAPVDDAVHTEIESVGTMIRDFRNAIGGNPVGTNAEITKALLGDNEKQVKFELPPGASLNGEGELVDRWGTPYFFHQLSGTQMDIRSAGPDRRMWTPDDVQGR